MKNIKFIDLFCGIGGFHLGLQRAAHNLGVRSQSVLSSDIDRFAKAAYIKNFPESVSHFKDDVKLIDSSSIENFDILCAGFPCQTFSQIGSRQGFNDNNRGNLFFEISRFLEEKRPSAFFLENVRFIVKHDNGKTLETIINIVNKLNYTFDYKVIKAYEFGLPQNRPRAYMVGFDKKKFGNVEFEFPTGENRLMKPLSQLLEVDWCEKEIGYTLRVSGRGSKYGDRHNWDGYKVRRDGEEFILRLTPEQGKRMMGFPEDWITGPSVTQSMKQLGNSVAVPVIEDIAQKIIERIM